MARRPTTLLLLAALLALGSWPAPARAATYCVYCSGDSDGNRLSCILGGSGSNTSAPATCAFQGEQRPVQDCSSYAPTGGTCSVSGCPAWHSGSSGSETYTLRAVLDSCPNPNTVDECKAWAVDAWDKYDC